MTNRTKENTYPSANSIELESKGLTWSMIGLIGIIMFTLVASYQPDTEQMVQQPPAKNMAPANFEIMDISQLQKS